MKTNTLKTLSLVLSLVLVGTPAFAKGKSSRSKQNATQAKTIKMDQHFDSLGGGEEIVRKAHALQPSNSMVIVQKRAVDRKNRFEIGMNYGYVSGGDAYVDTQNIGGTIDFHITPRWSIGARYNDNRNQLSQEGKRVFDLAAQQQATGQGGYSVPDVDFPLRSYMAVVNYYPVYGKISWFESAVSQFDMYLLAGGGQVELGSGSSNIYTGGLGMGFWWNNRFSTRMEARYETYRDRVYSGERNINSMIFQLGIGFML